jgi:putative inorganic carbon (HCO3(-)) transporter
MTTPVASPSRSQPVVLLIGLALAGAAVAAGALAAREPLAAIAVAAMAVLALAVIARPIALAAVIAFAIYLNVPGVLVVDHGAPQLAGAAVIALLVIPATLQLFRGQALIATTPFFLLLLLLAVNVVSTALSEHPGVAYDKTITLALEGVLLYLLVVNVVRTPADLRVMIWAVVAAAALLGALTLAHLLSGNRLDPYLGFAKPDAGYAEGYSTEFREAGPMGDPNYFAQVMVAALALALLRVRAERSRLGRTAAAVAVALILTGIVLSYSRGAALAVAIVLLGLLITGVVRLRYALALVVVAGVIIATVPGYSDRLSTLTAVRGATAASGSAGAADNSTRSRATEMLAAWYAFRDHPVLGVGPGVFPAYYEQYAQHVGIQTIARVRHGPQAGEQPQRAAHDMYLGIAAERGLVGLSVLFGIFALTLVGLARARRLAKGTPLADAAIGLMLALVAYLTAGIFLSLTYERYLWLLLALAGATCAIAGRMTRENMTRGVTW